ncbi:MAG: AI-2E family transporter [Polyangiaceae bacterium]|nr:AI-2E family transporter [Polyangiaceae bacterium]
MPLETRIPGQGARTLFVVTAACLLLGCFKLAAPIVVPLLLSAFVAAGMKPIIAALRRRGLPSWLAVLLAIVGAAMGVSSVAMLVVYATGEIRDAWPTYGPRLAAIKTQLNDWLQGVGFRHASVALQSLDLRRVGENALASSVAGITRVLTAAVLIIFVTIFMLLELGNLDLKLDHVRTSRGGAPLARSPLPFDEIQQYILLKTVACSISGVAVGLWTAVFGLSAPVLWGLLMFLLRLVPQLGAVVAGVPAVLLAAIELGVGPALAIGVGILVINMIVANAIEPRIMGPALGLSPLVVLMSVAVWGWVLGPVGALLSVPLTVAVKIYCASTEDLEWVAVLLGPARETHRPRFHHPVQDRNEGGE